MPPLAIMGGVGLAGSIGSALIGAHGAHEAADAQSAAAQQAAAYQKQQASNATGFQNAEWNQAQNGLDPWLAAGKGALGELSGLTSTPGQGLLAGFDQKFNAPTGATEQNDPGYQFRLQQGMSALNNTAAAKGNLLSANTLQSQQKFGQDYASNEYGNVYNRAMQDYMNQFNIFNSNQSNQYNRLAGLAGAGQNAANTLGQLGQGAANNIGNINMQSGQQVGQSLNNAGAAQASGYVGGANAWSQGLSGAANGIGQGIMLQQLMGGGGSAPYANYGTNVLQPSYMNPSQASISGANYQGAPGMTGLYGDVNMQGLPGFKS